MFEDLSEFSLRQCLKMFLHEQSFGKTLNHHILQIVYLSLLFFLSEYEQKHGLFIQTSKLSNEKCF